LDGFTDRYNNSLIHGGEPTQAVFFEAGSLIPIGQIDNRSHTEPRKIEGAPNIHWHQMLTQFKQQHGYDPNINPGALLEDSDIKKAWTKFLEDQFKEENGLPKSQKIKDLPRHLWFQWKKFSTPTDEQQDNSRWHELVDQFKREHGIDPEEEDPANRGILPSSYKMRAKWESFVKDRFKEKHNIPKNKPIPPELSDEYTSFGDVSSDTYFQGQYHQYGEKVSKQAQRAPFVLGNTGGYTGGAEYPTDAGRIERTIYGLRRIIDYYTTNMVGSMRELSPHAPMTHREPDDLLDVPRLTHGLARLAKGIRDFQNVRTIYERRPPRSPKAKQRVETEIQAIVYKINEVKEFLENILQNIKLAPYFATAWKPLREKINLIRSIIEGGKSSERLTRQKTVTVKIPSKPKESVSDEELAKSIAEKKNPGWEAISANQTWLQASNWRSQAATMGSHYNVTLRERPLPSEKQMTALRVLYPHHAEVDKLPEAVKYTKADKLKLTHIQAFDKETWQALVKHQASQGVFTREQEINELLHKWDWFWDDSFYQNLPETYRTTSLEYLTDSKVAGTLKTLEELDKVIKFQLATEQLTPSEAEHSKERFKGVIETRMKYEADPDFQRIKPEWKGGLPSYIAEDLHLYFKDVLSMGEKVFKKLLDYHVAVGNIGADRGTQIRKAYVPLFNASKKVGPLSANELEMCMFRAYDWNLEQLRNHGIKDIKSLQKIGAFQKALKRISNRDMKTVMEMWGHIFKYLPTDYDKDEMLQSVDKLGDMSAVKPESYTKAYPDKKERMRVAAYLFGTHRIGVDTFKKILNVDKETKPPVLPKSLEGYKPPSELEEFELPNFNILHRFLDTKQEALKHLFWMRVTKKLDKNQFETIRKSVQESPWVTKAESEWTPPEGFPYHIKEYIPDKWDLDDYHGFFKSKEDFKQYLRWMYKRGHVPPRHINAHLNTADSYDFWDKPEEEPEPEAPEEQPETEEEKEKSVQSIMDKLP
jgi:hypothetical protein